LKPLEIFLLGLAKGASKSSFTELIAIVQKVSKLQLSGRLSDTDRLIIEIELFRGDLQMAKSMLSISCADPELLPPLEKADSLSDRLKLELVRSVSFPDRVEISGRLFARSSRTGEVIDVGQAEIL
jgi:hypothetical protein